MKTLDEFVNQLRAEHAMAVTRLAKWTEQVNADPSKMRWVPFNVAATIEVLGQIIAAKDRDASAMTMDNLLDHCRAQVLSQARFTESSTSVASNTMDRERLAVWADLANPMRWP